MSVALSQTYVILMAKEMMFALKARVGNPRAKATKENISDVKAREKIRS